MIRYIQRNETMSKEEELHRVIKKRTNETNILKKELLESKLVNVKLKEEHAELKGEMLAKIDRQTKSYFTLKSKQGEGIRKHYFYLNNMYRMIAELLPEDADVKGYVKTHLENVDNSEEVGYK